MIRLLSPPGIITGGIVVLSVAGGMVVGAGIASVLLAAHAIKRARA